MDSETKFLDSKNNLRWDGSEIPVHYIKILSAEKTISSGIDLCDVEINGKKMKLYARDMSSSLKYPCILDEIKKFFGVQAVGSHWTRKTGLKYLFPYENREYECCDLDDPDLHMKLRKIYAVSEILASPISHSSWIQLRKRGPVCVFQNTNLAKVKQEFVSQKIKAKIFESEKDFRNCMASIIDDIKPAEFNFAVQNILKRVDPDASYGLFLEFIYGRFLDLRQEFKK